MDVDDDVPPSLQDLEQQVRAVQDSRKPVAPVGSAVAAVACMQPIPPVTRAPALRRGFLDANPTVKAASRHRKAASSGTPAGDAPFIRASDHNRTGTSGAAIPECLILPPDAQQVAYDALKCKLVNALRPTPDMVEQVTKDTALMAGFDDPEVMAAVAEIARNPDAMHHYKNNRKVTAFYATMGSMMGSKLSATCRDHWQH